MSDAAYAEAMALERERLVRCEVLSALYWRFTSVAETDRWLESPNPGLLGGETPAKLLSSGNATAVRDLLCNREWAKPTNVHVPSVADAVQAVRDGATIGEWE